MPGERPLDICLSNKRRSRFQARRSGEADNRNPTIIFEDGRKAPEGEEDGRGVMLNADGEYVQVMTDTKTWEKFQEKANASKAQAANADAANKELEERGLVCPIDKRMYVDPVKTPCCGKTYCHDCIENALADGDLVCPNCSTDGVLIDDLVADEDMVGKIRAYETEKAKEKVDKEQQKEQQTKEAAGADAATSSNAIIEPKVDVPTTADEKAKTSDVARSGSKSPGPDGKGLPVSSTDVTAPLSVAANPSAEPASAGAGNGSDTDTSSTSKKRKEAPTDIKAPTAPKAMRLQKEQQTRQTQDTSSLEKNFIESMEALKNMPNNMPIIPPTPMSMSMGVPMNPMMGAMNPPNVAGMNPMQQQMGMNGMNGYGNFNPGWNGGYNNGYQNQQQYGNMGYGNGMNGFGNMGYNNMQGNMSGYGNGWNGQGQGYGNMGYNNQGMQQNGNFQNQQRGTFAEQPNQQDAYERRPLNPHRAQNRNRKQRAPDYHYVG